MVRHELIGGSDDLKIMINDSVCAAVIQLMQTKPTVSRLQIDKP